MKCNKIVMFVVVITTVIIFVCGVIYYWLNTKSPKTNATGTTAILSSQSDWEAMTRDNIDTTSSSGSIKINNKALAYTMVDIPPENVSASSNSNLATNILANDSNVWYPDYPYTDTYNPISPPVVTGWLKIDLGQDVDSISRIYGDCATAFDHYCKVYYSSDDSNYTYIEDFGEPSLETPDIVDFAPLTARYFRIDYLAGLDFGLPSSAIAYFRVLTSSANGTVTTQIDGGENFWSWDSNTITETVPANTSTSYQYRTSANGTDWTSWVGSIGSVTNRTGDDSNNPTRYRYLQIKATLSNTDGVSTPQIDSYDIDYHTEVKPTAPSAQTAVIQ